MFSDFPGGGCWRPIFGNFTKWVLKVWIGVRTPPTPTLDPRIGPCMFNVRYVVFIFFYITCRYTNAQIFKFWIISLSELVAYFLGRIFVESFSLPKSRMSICLSRWRHMEVGAETFDISCSGTFAPNMRGTPWRNILYLFLKQRKFDCHMWGRRHFKCK